MRDERKAKAQLLKEFKTQHSLVAQLEQAERRKGD